jgi:pyruvate/2-oxoglutarate dehydrogenase complex dihydrolipoamide acyltransferase (E2) component
MSSEPFRSFSKMNKPTAVRVPQMNVNDDNVRILSWLVVCGAKVNKGDYLVEVETSKSTVEIEAPEEGYIHFTLEAGAEVAIGDVLCVIGSEPGVSTPTTASSVAPAAANGVASGFPKQEAVAAAVNGHQKLDNHPPRLDRSPGAASQGEAGRAEQPLALAPSPAGDPEGAAPPVTRLSARARALLEARGLDPSLCAGKGLVRERDILCLIDADHSNAGAEPVSARALCPTPAVKPADGVPARREKLSRQKVMEAKVLAAGYHNALASNVTIACPTRGLRRLVQNDHALRNNATALIIFETARLLRQFPAFNGYYQGEEVCFYQKVNIGFAVDAGQGLKVLAIHDADSKPLATVADEMHELVAQYLDNRLPMKALTGSTFTISDLSGDGVTSFTPLINQGQSAILGVGAERFLPPSGEGEFCLTLTFDHQLAEGRTAARFLNALKDRLKAHEVALAPASRRTSKTKDAAGEALFCGRCLRTADQMRELDGYLLRTAGPDGCVCSLCLNGY